MVKHEEETAPPGSDSIRDGVGSLLVRDRAVDDVSFLSRMCSLAPILGGLAGLIYALAFFAYFFSFSIDFPNGARISLELALAATLMLLTALSIDHFRDTY